MKSKSKYYSHCLLTFAFVSMAVQVCFAQIEFTEHTISDDFDGAHSVYAIDVDSDGDIDVLGASMYGSGIIWWENDGNQDFTEHIIEEDFNQGESVYAIDLDGDDDIDVLGAAFGPARITWWENDGDENFTEHIIYDGGNPTCVYAADIDGDDDIDILSTTPAIGWWENDGDENFRRRVIDRFDGGRSVYSIDVDSDGDIDVLGAAFNADDITWWENDGEERFTEHTIDGNFDYAESVYAIDVDSDGDVDVLGAGYRENITWWENDGDENFTEHVLEGEDVIGTTAVYAIDVDGDDDIDVLGSGAGTIAWWENDGNEDFTEHTFDGDFGVSSVYAIDVDGDGDIDVVGSASGSDEITWWESDLDLGLIWRALPDSSFVEDGSLQLSLEYIYDHIRSPNFPDEDLVITVEDGEHVFGEIVDDILHIAADQDWTGLDSLMLTVTDPNENSATAYQRLTVTPLNDPPEPFNLLTPEDSHEVQYNPDSLGTLDFTWQAAEQNEYETDAVNYIIEFRVDESVFRTGLLETPEYMNIPIQFLTDTLALERWDPITFLWQVRAFDSEDSTLANEAPWTFTIPTLGVGADLSSPIPDHCFMSPTFPNPFNSTTTISYGLPYPGNVSLQVYNLSGQRITTLFEGYRQAGVYTANLYANDLPSGVYVYSLQAGRWKSARKLVLVR